jgi:serine/threonine-protein kinase HipA
MAELVIWMDGRRVGVLDGTDRDSLRLAYDPDWIADPDATALSVSMPLAAETYAGDVVRAYLWGLLPDNEQLLDRWARAYGTSATNVFGLLQGVGADVAGAAQYLDPDVDPSTAGSIDPLTDDDIAELLAEAVADRSPWQPSHLGRWSLAGAQAKIALARDPTTGAWGRPHGNAPTTHILKPAIPGLDDHDHNEHLCLATAGRLGLRTASTSVERFGDTGVIVVERYDRRWRDGRLHRVHQEDGCQALAVHPGRKYEADGGPTLEQLAGVIWDHVGPRARDDVAALVRAVAFSWLILGVDAHAKNYSFLLAGPEVRLAPLYDIASAATHFHPRKLKLAQKVGGEYRVTVIGRRHWERLARAVRLAPDTVIGDITALADAIPDAFADSARDLPMTGPLLDAVTDWVGQCRRALS